MESIARNYGPWLAKCIILGSIPGTVCWSVWTWLGGFATFAF